MYQAQTRIQTDRASRYLKALCNHFSRKVSAQYSDNEGVVQFGFADCEMVADDHSLKITVEADNTENFERVKYIIHEHLQQFTSDNNLVVIWENC